MVPGFTISPTIQMSPLIGAAFAGNSVKVSKVFLIGLNIWVTSISAASIPKLTFAFDVMLVVEVACFDVCVVLKLKLVLLNKYKSTLSEVVL